MARMFLIPLILAIGWSLFLMWFRIPFRQGLKGFYWIIGLGSAMAGFFSLMIWLTH
ncbi:hypothetical protein [Aeromonas simiae]|uniref:hypothetical protein n=1 Tax=Aeromonas simiae TaxID=218936 RepID=UPI0018691B8E|nr:hypothetical protein [Aeromonas simiae]